jgi:CO/xanthine dehydrogenase FAD-binding subunit
VRAPDELVTGIAIPAPLHATTARSSFVKLGARAYLVISIAMVGAVVEVAADGRIARARVAIGACSEVAQRLTALEQEIVGQPATAASIGGVVRAEHVAGLRPIDDVRGTAAYRRDAALTTVRRALEAALG